MITPLKEAEEKNRKNHIDLTNEFKTHLVDFNNLELDNNIGPLRLEIREMRKLIEDYEKDRSEFERDWIKKSSESMKRTNTTI